MKTLKTKILDCTIRDGGYLNRWQFPVMLVKDLYRAVSKSGVDYIEIGFRNSQKFNHSAEMELWCFTPEDKVEEVVRGVSGAEIALMVDYGKADLDDIPPAQQSRVSLYRVAVHKNQVPQAVEFANAIAAKGYKASVQLMGIAGYTTQDFKNVLGPLKRSKLSYVYFADSYGSLLPSDIRGFVSTLRKAGKPIGFHPHNNMQLAFSNTLEAIKRGVDIVDGTVFGMGRGAGNLPIETLIAYFEKTMSSTRYNVLPVLELIDKYFLVLVRELVWGYNLPYMISGVYGVHPNYATELMQLGRYTMEDVLSALQLINRMNPVGFDKHLVSQMVKAGFVGYQSSSEMANAASQPSLDTPFSGPVPYKHRHRGRSFLILANGPSLVLYQVKIRKFIERYNPIIIGSNYLSNLYVPHYHTFNHLERFAADVAHVHPSSKLLLSGALSPDFVRRHTNREYEVIRHVNEVHRTFEMENGVIINSGRAISILSIAVAIAMGAQRIFVAGMDGYKDAETFLRKAIRSDTPAGDDKKDGTSDLSARSGAYMEQMEWHHYIDKLLRDINEYLVTNGLEELAIITPTTHKFFYRDIEGFLSPKSSPNCLYKTEAIVLS